MTSAPPVRSSADGLSVAPSPLLKSKLAGLRRKHVRTAALTGLALLVSAAIEIMAVLLFFDWLIDFPWAFRAVLFAAQIALWIYLTIRFVLMPVLRQPDDDELALLVEKANPKLRTRLIASIQLARPDSLLFGASPVLAQATVRETERLSHPLDFTEIVPTERLHKLGLLAVLVSAIAAFALLYGQPTTSDLLKRAFLSHVSVPRKTRVLVQDGNKTIGKGDSVRLEAFAQGIIPKSGHVEVKYRSHRIQEYNLEADKQNRARFGRTIDNVQDSFTYVVFLNDGRSETYNVKALPRPTVAAVECEQQYPAYTGLKPVRRALGDLSLLAGSVLKLKITATKPIAQASIKLVGVATNATPQSNASTIQQFSDLTISPNKPQELTGQLRVPAKGLTGFSVQLRDTEGMDSVDSAIYRVDIIPDKPPVVRLTYPDRKEELITRHATMLVGMDISDDFEIAKVRIRYKVYALAPTLTLGNIPRFALRLKTHADPVTQYFWDKLPTPTRESLNAYNGATNQVQPLREMLAEDLNRIFRAESIYDKQRFTNVTLAADTKEFLGENPQGENLLRLNQLLTRDAFPKEIKLDDAVEQTLDLDLEGAHPQKLKRRYEWKIGSFDPLLPEGTRLEFWLEAQDNNNATGPGIGVSEHQFAKIVSDAEKRADLFNRAGDYLGSISDVAGDQEKLNVALGGIIRDKSK